MEKKKGTIADFKVTIIVQYSEVYGERRHDLCHLADNFSFNMVRRGSNGIFTQRYQLIASYKFSLFFFLSLKLM